MLRKLLVPFALFAAAGTAQAGDKPIYAPAPAWVKAGPPIDATHLTDADPMLLRLDQQQRILNAEVAAYADTAMRMNSPQMLTQAGTIQLPWDPAKGDLTIHTLEIVRGAEHIDLIAAGQRFSVLRREQQLEQASLNGLLTATLAVEGLRVGDVLHMRYSVTRKDPALHGNFQAILPLLALPAPLANGRVRLLWPAALPVQWRTYAKEAAPVVTDTADHFRELTLALPLPKPAALPADAPARFRPLPIIEATSYTGWPNVSKDMSVLFATDGAMAPNSPVAAEVARIAAASNDPRVRAAMALQLVQDEIRYLFNGMDDGNYVPQKPGQTWSLRYGDCKAKTMLLLAMLRALGIEAEPVLASIGMGDLVQMRLPAPSAFNHVLVHAMIGGKDLWLDGTGSGSRLADLDDTPALRFVLPLRSAGAELMAVPMHPDARPMITGEVDVDSRAGILFPAAFTARVTLRGPAAEMIRMMSSQGGKEQSDQMIDSAIGTYVANAQPVEREVSYDAVSGTTTLTVSGIASPQWEKDGARYKLALDSLVDGLTFAPDRSRAAWKDIPVAAGDAAGTRVVTRIRLPDGGKGFALEGDQTLPATLAGNILRRSVSFADGLITVDDRGSGNILEVAPADIPAARQQVALAKARLLRAQAPLDYPPRWRQLAAARQSGAFAPTLAVFAKRIAADPGKADGYKARAAFLATIYDYRGAIGDLDKIIAIDPTGDNYEWRGRLWILAGDEKRALADMNSAIAVNPGSTSAFYQIATLRARAGESEAALALVTERLADGGKEGDTFVELKAELLGDAGRVAEGVAVLDDAIKAKPGNPSLLNARCWLKGTRNVQLDTALRDCTKSIELSDNPANALDSRGMVYFRMARWDDALADFNAALDSNAELPASLFMRGLVRVRMGDAAAARDDLAAARAINPRVDADYARYGIKP